MMRQVKIKEAMLALPRLTGWLCYQGRAPRLASWGSVVGLVASLSVLSLSLMLSGCGDDNINKVRQGYFPGVTNKNVEEIIALYPFLAEGKWSNVSGAKLPQVNYRAPLTNQALVSWALASLPEATQKQVATALDQANYRINLDLNFTVFQNGSFELDKIALSYHDQELSQVATRAGATDASSVTPTQALLARLINKEQLSDEQVPAAACADFNYYLYRTLLKDQKVEGIATAQLLPKEQFTLRDRILGDEEVYLSFSPLLLSTIDDLRFDEKERAIALSLTTNLTNVNDYRLNEVGTGFFDSYALLGDVSYRSLNYHQVINTIAPYDYAILARKEGTLWASFDELPSNQGYALAKLGAPYGDGAGLVFTAPVSGSTTGTSVTNTIAPSTSDGTNRSASRTQDAVVAIALTSKDKAYLKLDPWAANVSTSDGAAHMATDNSAAHASANASAKATANAATANTDQAPDVAVLNITLAPDFTQSESFKAFMNEQATVLGYTTIAYPMAAASTVVTSLFQQSNAQDTFEILLSIRNRLMQESKEKIPEKLARSNAI